MLVLFWLGVAAAVFLCSLSFSSFELTEWHVNLVGFVALGFTCLAGVIAVLIYKSQTRLSAGQHDDSQVVLRDIGEAARKAAKYSERAAIAVSLLRRPAARRHIPVPAEREARDIGDVTQYLLEQGEEIPQVLWVDDHDDWIADEREAFHLIGVSTVWVPDTQTATALLEGNRFRAVITDLRRGDQADAGLELLAATQSGDFSTPVIMYSTSNDPDFIAEVQGLGAHSVTNDPSELFSIVLDVIRQNLSLSTR